MKTGVFIDACVRGKDSRTLRIAGPIFEALCKKNRVIVCSLTGMEEIVPLNADRYAERARGEVPEWAKKSAHAISIADFIVIAAPFWDMSFPAILKCFFEQVSLFDITFTDTGKTCKGLCKAPKVLYITTRGMDIPTYLKALGTLWNLGEITTLAAWNMDYSSPEEIDAKIQACIEEGLDIIKDW